MLNDSPWDRVIWAAGIIDGEGCIDIDAPIRWNLRVTIGMCHRPTIIRLRTIFGRKGSSFYLGQGARPFWVLKYHGAAAYALLDGVYEYLLTKKREARIAMDLMRPRLTKKWQRLSLKEKERWMKAKVKLQEIKRINYEH